MVAPLHLAALQEQKAVVQSCWRPVLTRTRQPSTASQHGTKTLCGGHEAVSQRLLEAGADKQESDSRGFWMSSTVVSGQVTESVACRNRQSMCMHLLRLLLSGACRPPETDSLSRHTTPGFVAIRRSWKLRTKPPSGLPSTSEGQLNTARTRPRQTRHTTSKTHAWRKPDQNRGGMVGLVDCFLEGWFSLRVEVFVC